MAVSENLAHQLADVLAPPAGTCRCIRCEAAPADRRCSACGRAVCELCTTGEDPTYELCLECDCACE